MCEIEGNRKSGYAERGEPFFGKPDVRSNPESPALERFIERIDARLEPGSLDGEAEVLDAELKQSFVRPAGPWASSVLGRHSGYYSSEIQRLARNGQSFQASMSADHRDVDRHCCATCMQPASRECSEGRYVGSELPSDFCRTTCRGSAGCSREMRQMLGAIGGAGDIN